MAQFDLLDLTGDPEPRFTNADDPQAKSPLAYRTISEVAEMLKVPVHVLRFWETKFSQLKPTKAKGGRRYYRPEDIALLKQIYELLYGRGFTIKGAEIVLSGVAEENAALQVAADIRANAAHLPTLSPVKIGEMRRELETALAELKHLRHTLAPYRP